MAEAVAEKGYVGTSVADVLRRARVSRETFYQNFADKQACFLASLDHSATILVSVMGSAFVDTAVTPRQRFDKGMRAYLEALAAEPAVARSVLIESMAAGREAQEKRFSIKENFAKVLQANYATEPGWQALPDSMFFARALVGAISSLVVSVLAMGDPAELPALHKPIMDLLDHFGL